MKCPNCGADNKDGYRFCAKCGTRLEEIDLEDEKTVILDDEDVRADFEDEKTVILDDRPSLADFENDETVILDDQPPFADLEDEKTVILDDRPSLADFEDEKTVVLDEVRTPPAAPDFDYRTVYREYRTDYQDTAYIDHLRRLKELLDDGIITEDEFTRKKQQILGLE